MLVYFCNMIDVNNSRYFPPKTFLSAYNAMNLDLKLEELGRSEEERPIYGLTLGTGKKKVLAWSQMHGNETTTTKALLDLLHHLETSAEGKLIKEGVCFRIIFQLNPDGAYRYTRLNANQVDLNRDAVAQTQQETKVLMQEFASFAPDFCLNLHGQRTIFAAGTTTKPAALSFLAPSANAERSITPTRKIAMQLIAALIEPLVVSNEWGIGRYDDGFNINCVGDYFTAKDVPTLLYEAGHFPGDYNRSETRRLIFESLINVLKSIGNESYKLFSSEAYFGIPENSNHLRDLEFKNVTIVNNQKVTKSSLFVQYTEYLKDGQVRFFPEYVGNQSDWSGLRQIDLAENSTLMPIDINDSSEKIMESLISLM